MLPMKIAVHRLDASVQLPRLETPGAAGFDLAASADVSIAPGEIALIPTGLVIGVPAGHFLGIFARSSTPLKRGLMVANGVGVVDSDYCGPADEVKVQVLNITHERVHVRKGDRIAQGVILAFARAEIEDAPRPQAKTRGGFGSTGT